mmetsp:Transcript_58549/g.70455  ORF Transcript_58549/g.70455 Transcript_58549/m.70455 type:complete len:368 (+) Transcript_58549:181-1284(+)
MMAKKKPTKAENKRTAKNAERTKQSTATHKSRNKIAMNAEIAGNTLKILDQGWYQYSADQDYQYGVDQGLHHCVDNEEKVVVSLAQQQQRAVAETILYTPDLGKLEQHDQDKRSKKKEKFHDTIIEMNDLTSLDAVRKLVCEEQKYEGSEEKNARASKMQQQSQPSILCLNFASGKNAGGGFLRGSEAQEESIVRASGLFPCLIQDSMQGYYNANQAARAPFYTDHMIYSPNVPVFKNEDGSLLEKPILVSFLTAPAVNVSVAQNRKEKGGLNNSMVETIMRRRIAKILQIAKEHRHECLVLGAWGCGVFGNDPKDVASWFSKELISFQFRKIVFAIYSSNMQFLKAFLWEFKRCDLEALEEKENQV